MKKNLLETEYAKVWVENDVMIAVFKPKELTLDIARHCVATRVAAANGEIYPVLIDTRAVKSITKDARDYFASDEGAQKMKAAALLLDSFVGKIMGNFFLQINQPKVPIRIFNSEADAVKWLQQFNEK